MKNIFKVFVISAGIVLFFNVNSFALVDGAVWGGSVFKGQVEGGVDTEPTSWQYGAKAHYNFSLIPLIEMGVGAYYQDTKIKFDVLNSSSDVSRKSIGFDANVLLSIPIIHPYLRGTYAFWDKYDTDVQNFKAYGVGAGVELVVFPFIRLFGEYMYELTDHDGKLTTSSANFGIKADI